MALKSMGTQIEWSFESYDGLFTCFNSNLVCFEIFEWLTL